ncbi:hypothetical protein HYV80_05510 [Candidatus Woesearchaeota archaeon]|nr:hypothetical protein [Candidatus Woesearchaeota archaeon]
MSNLVNVHDGSSKCPPLAFVRKQNIGLAPSATYSTPYAIHDKLRQEGYIGLFDNDSIVGQQPETIREKLQSELQPAIEDIRVRRSVLEILIAGTEICGLSRIIPMPEHAIKEYERDVRHAIAESFAKSFPDSKITLRFNDCAGSSNCLIYIPHLDFADVVLDTCSWSGTL